MRAFAEAFFGRFGARVFPLDDELVVDLPTDLATAFGKPRLYLVFAEEGAKRELSPAEDLLAYGSRTFDQMLALLAGRGEIAHLRLPPQFPTESPLSAHRGDTSLSRDQSLFLPLHNCRVVERQVHSNQARFYVFNFRAVYLSDEKREEFIAVVLDSEGCPRPDKTGELTDPELLRGGVFLPPDRPLHIGGETLSRMLGHAGEVARQLADTRAAELEDAIQPRLGKALLRLTTFYRRLTDEVDTGDSEQDETIRADLARDLARKIADELERHRLRVTLSPLSYAVALIPIAHYRLTLATRHTQQVLEVGRDLYTGQAEPLPCRHCREPIQRLALCDRRGHPIHPGCLETCDCCDRDVCQSCGVRSCAICGDLVCFDCIALCARCDDWLCAEHVGTCSACGEPVCESCADACAACGIPQCREHLTPCLACGEPTCDEHRWPCHVCGRESCEAHADICGICGEPYCVDHSFHCSSCEQTYCLQCGSELADECQTCRLALASLVIEPTCLPFVPGIAPGNYQWRRAENRQVVIYLGKRWLGQVVVVTDKTGRLLHWRKTGPLPLLAEVLQLGRR